MKTITTLTLITIFSITAYSQNISKLDEKNGFKEFKLGDSYNKWATSIKYTTAKNKCDVYKYTGECCKDIYGHPITDIFLYFKNNKLVNIQVSLDYFTRPYKESGIMAVWSAEHIDKIKSNLILLFGEHMKLETFDNSKEGGAKWWWYGHNVVLELRYVCYDLQSGDTGFIFVSSADYLRETADDGF